MADNLPINSASVRCTPEAVIAGQESERRLGVAQRPMRLPINLLRQKEIDMETHDCSAVARRVPWNKGRLTGQKPPLKLREIWGIRARLQMSSNVRELAMFNLAIDSKLRACDLTRLQDSS